MRERYDFIYVYVCVCVEGTDVKNLHDDMVKVQEKSN